MKNRFLYLVGGLCLMPLMLIRQNRKAVRVQYTVPVNFRLH